MIDLVNQSEFIALWLYEKNSEISFYKALPFFSCLARILQLRPSSKLVSDLSSFYIRRGSVIFPPDKITKLCPIVGYKLHLFCYHTTTKKTYLTKTPLIDRFPLLDYPLKKSETDTKTVFFSMIISLTYNLLKDIKIQHP